VRVILKTFSVSLYERERFFQIPFLFPLLQRGKMVIQTIIFRFEPIFPSFVRRDKGRFLPSPTFPSSPLSVDGEGFTLKVHPEGELKGVR